jgi:hypothetical protein
LEEEELAGKMSQFFFEYPPELKNQGVHIWIGDKENEGDEQTARAVWLYQDDQSIAEVGPTDIEAELTQFSANYRDELEQLHDAYGTGKVAVKWGILHAVHC